MSHGSSSVVLNGLSNGIACFFTSFIKVRTSGIVKARKRLSTMFCFVVIEVNAKGQVFGSTGVKQVKKCSNFAGNGLKMFKLKINLR